MNLLTPTEVAERLGVTVEWVRQHARGKRRPCLPSVKLGKAIRFRPEDIEAFIAQHLRRAA